MLRPTPLFALLLLTLPLALLTMTPPLAAQATGTIDVFEEVSIHDRTGLWQSPVFQGPLFDDFLATGVASVDLDPSTPRPELLLYNGTAIGCFDFLTTVCGGPAIPTPPAAVEALVGITQPGGTAPSLVMANGSDLYTWDVGAAAWSGPDPQGFTITSLAAAHVLGSDDEDLIASDGTTIFALDLAVAGAPWVALPAPPGGNPDSIAGVDVGFADDDAMGNPVLLPVRLLAAHVGGTTQHFVPASLGGPSWSFPYQRRFGVSSAAPIDFGSQPANPLGTAVVPTALNTTAIRLADVASQVGLGDPYRPGGDGHCPGVVFTDLDGDDFPDLYLPKGNAMIDDVPTRQANVLLLNDGAGNFTEAGDTATANLGNAAGAIAADFDNDGRRDLYVTNFMGRNVLLRNTLDGYVDVTAATDPTEADDDQAGLAVGCDDGETEPGCSLDATLAAAAGDFDRDGDLDLFVGNQQCCTPDFTDGERDVLYENLGDGTFRDITYDAGIEERGVVLNKSTQALLVADFNNDRWPDIYLTHKGIGPNDHRDELFLNDGDQDGDNAWDGTFTEYFTNQTLDPDLGFFTCAAMGVDAADYDQDGDLDVFLTDISGNGSCAGVPPSDMDLYKNLLAETGTFDLERVDPNPVASPDFAWGTSWQDLDNDGDQELHVSTAGNQLSWVHENLGGGAFADVTIASGGAVARESRASVPADFDRDGFVDLLVAHREPTLPVTLFQNQTREAPNRRSVSIRLEGNTAATGPWNSTLEAVGARIDVTLPGGAVLRRDVYVGGHSCGSTRDFVAHFGVGSAASVTVQVRWPSGGPDTVTSVATCQTAPCPVVVITEP